MTQWFSEGRPGLPCFISLTGLSLSLSRLSLPLTLQSSPTIHSPTPHSLTHSSIFLSLIPAQSHFASYFASHSTREARGRCLIGMKHQTSPPWSSSVDRLSQRKKETTNFRLQQPSDGSAPAVGLPATAFSLLRPTCRNTPAAGLIVVRVSSWIPQNLPAGSVSPPPVPAQEPRGVGFCRQKCATVLEKHRDCGHGSLSVTGHWSI